MTCYLCARPTCLGECEPQLKMDDSVQQKIRKKYDSISSKIEKLQDELKALQDSCDHPNVLVKRRADTDNYDPSADRYWTDFGCPDCSKRWTTEQ